LALLPLRAPRLRHLLLRLRLASKHFWALLPPRILARCWLLQNNSLLKLLGPIVRSPILLNKALSSQLLYQNRLRSMSL